MFSFRAFGGACLEKDDRPLSGPVAQRRRLGMLALLAASPTRRMSRDKLASYLWPEADAEHARGLLGDALYALRRELGKSSIVTAGDELRLNSERIRTDVGEFRDALAQDDRSRAVELYRGPFLDGFFIPDAPEFERWAEIERDRFARETAKALEALAEEREAAADWAMATDWWLRLAAHDPSNSRVALRAMRALDAAGDRAGAIRHGSAHQALLQRELELDPDPAVLAWVEQLRAEPASSNLAPDERAPGVAVPSRAARAEPIPVPAGIAAPLASLAGRRTKSVALAGAVVVLVFVGVVATRGPRGLLGDGRLAQGDAVIVAEFEDASGDPVLANTVGEALRIDLQQSLAVRILGPEQVRETLRLMERPNAVLTPELAREVAIRDGAKAVVVGSVAKGGPGHILSARLIAAGTGEELIALRETAADSTRLIPAIDRLSERMRRRIGESVRAIRASAPLERVTTGSLEALRKYSQAGRAAFVESDADRAILLLENAIALDSAFGSAHTLLHSVLHVQSVLGGPDNLARRTDALTEAFEHRDRLTERERHVVEAAYFTHVLGDVQRSVTTMRAAVDAFPEDPLMAGLLGVYYSWLPDLARAEESILRALALQPAAAPSPIALHNLASIQTSLAKFDEASATWQRLIDSHPDQTVLHALGTSYTAGARGDYEAAERLLHDLRNAGPDDPSMRVATSSRLASLATLRGQLGAAERYLREADGAAAGDPAVELRRTLVLARQDLLLRGSAERASRRIDAALLRVPLDSIAPLDRPYLELAWIFAHAGRADRARQLLSDFEVAVPPELRRLLRPAREPDLHAWASAAIALAEGRPEETIALLGDAAGACVPCTLPMLGVAWEHAGQPDSAIAAYERFLRPEMRAWTTVDMDWLVPVHLHLADLYYRRGHDEQAARLYARVLELWNDADPELRPQMQEVEQRLRSLVQWGR